MAIFFGLLAALFWGLTDFLAQRSGKAVGAYRSMLFSQIIGVTCIGLWIAMSPATRGIVPQAAAFTWLVAVASALVGIVATLSLFKALIGGQIGTVVPIAASYGAVSAMLAIVAGEHVTAPIGIGLLACVAGAILSAVPQREREASKQIRSHLPTIWAVGAALAYGVQFWMLGRLVTPHLGPIIPVFVYYATGLAIFLFVRVWFAPPVVLPQGKIRLLVVATALAAIGGYLAISTGLATGQIAIVTVLSSFQSGITVLLAWVILKERLAVHQIVGVLMVVGGLALIHAFE